MSPDCFIQYFGYIIQWSSVIVVWYHGKMGLRKTTEPEEEWGGSFPMSQFFASGGQSIGVSASTSVLPMNTQDWSALWWTGWISLQSKGLSRVFSNTTVQKHQFFGTQVSLQSSSHSAAHFYIVRYNNNLNIKPVLGDKSIRIGMNLFYKNYYLQNFCKQQLLLILLNLIWPFHFF